MPSLSLRLVSSDTHLARCTTPQSALDAAIKAALFHVPMAGKNRFEVEFTALDVTVYVDGKPFITTKPFERGMAVKKPTTKIKRLQGRPPEAGWKNVDALLEVPVKFQKNPSSMWAAFLDAGENITKLQDIWHDSVITLNKEKALKTITGPQMADRLYANGKLIPPQGSKYVVTGHPQGDKLRVTAIKDL